MPLHGPFTNAWNVVLTDQSLNNRMITPEQKAVKEFGVAQLQYEVTVEYFSSQQPPPEAFTLAEADVEDVKRWVDIDERSAVRNDSDDARAASARSGS